MAIGGLAVGLLIAALALAVTETSWGHAPIKALAERSVARSLAGGAHFRIGALSGGLGRAWTLDSVAIAEPTGEPIVTIARVRATVSLRALLTGDIRLGIVEVRGVEVRLHQDTAGVWNAQRLARTAAAPGSGRGAPPPLVTADSMVVRDANVLATRAVATPGVTRVDSIATVRDIRIDVGPTTLSSPTGAGRAWATLVARVESPRLSTMHARAALRWWRDSVMVDSAMISLPGSRVSGRVAARGLASDSVRLIADVVADSVAFADLRAIIPKLPASGVVTATATVQVVADGRATIAIGALTARSGRAVARARATVVTGRQPEVRGLQLDVAGLDLTLVRDIVGPEALPPEWNGTVSAVVAGSGSSRRFVLDRVDARFDDARTRTASRVLAAGALGMTDAGLQLEAMSVRADPLVVRTLGAALAAADSVPGTLVASALLDGTSSALRVDELRLTHVDGNGARSVVHGSATVSGAGAARALFADLIADTIAVATLAHQFPALGAWKLRHDLAGTLLVEATARSAAFDAAVAAGPSRLRVAGDAQFRGDSGTLSATAQMDSLDPRAVSARAGLPVLRLSGTARIVGSWGGADTTAVADIALDSTSTVGAAPLMGAGARVALDGRGVRIDTLQAGGAGWNIAASGRLPFDSLAVDSLTFALSVDSLDAFRQLVVDSAGEAVLARASGRLAIDRGIVHGSLASPRVRATMGLDVVATDAAAVRLGIVTVDLAGLRGRTTGTARATLAGVSAAGYAFDSASISATLAEGSRALVRFRAVSGDSAEVAGVSEAMWGGDSIVVRMDSAVATLSIGRWRLARPAVVARAPDRWDVRELEFRTAGGASLSVLGTVPDTGALQIAAALAGLRLTEVPAAADFPRDLAGAVNGHVRIEGTRNAPRITFAATLDSARNAEVSRPAIRVSGAYADRVATMEVDATVAGRRVLAGSARVPLDLTLDTEADRLVDAPVTIRLTTDSLPLSAFDGLVPRTRGLSGHIQGTVDLAGTLRRPRGTGRLLLRGGAVEVPRSGVALRDAQADLLLDGDSVIVTTIRAADADAPTDTAAVSGVVRFAGSSWKDWTVALRSVANNFRVLDDPRLASAEADWDLNATGTLGRPRLGGNVRLPYAVFTIGPQRRTRVLPSDSALAVSAGVPVAQGIVVSLGSDVRLKSREANVQLAGAVELIGPLDRPWISGMLEATRGTYRVDLGVIKRTFRVDSGTVIVEGTSDDAAVLDIRTSYTVRRAGEDDVKIGAHLYGTTDRPRLDLSSDLGTATAQSEVISYLVFGKPSFQAPQSRQATERTATAAIVPSLGGWLEGVLGAVLPFFNTLQVTTVASDDPRISFQNPLEGLLSSVAVTGGRQVGTDTFFSISAGTCSGSRVASTGNVPLWLGAAAEYRPRRSVGAAISVDPGPAPCSRVGAIADTYQVGFDLLYTWRFGRRP